MADDPKTDQPKTETPKGSIYVLNTGAWTGVQTWAGPGKGSEVTLSNGDQITLTDAEFKALRLNLKTSLLKHAEWVELEKMAKAGNVKMMAPNKPEVLFK